MLPGGVRHPTVSVLVAGAKMGGPITAEISANSHYQADSYRLTLALNDIDGRDLDWWGSDDRVGELYEVKIALDEGPVSLIVGEADKIDIHPVTGAVDITGRDLTARFIDNRIQEAFQNKTASEIVTLLATRRGLTPVVTATTTPATRYYDADHDRVSQDQFSHTGTEWDLMTFLAQREGFDLFVQRKELHFQPATDPTKAEPYGVHWNQDERVSDVLRLDLDRSLTLAKDVVVAVRSWSSKAGRGFTKVSPAGSNGKVSSGKAQRFSYTFPNLTEDQAQKRADQLRAEITKHERNISFDTPGELDLTPRDVIQISGVGGWDQRYYVNTITRRISFDGGFTQTVTAKNHSPESDAATP